MGLHIIKLRSYACCFIADVENVPEDKHQECSKDGLVETFSALSKNGFLQDEPILVGFYGANFHDVTDKGHWIEVIASIFKNGNAVEGELGKELVSCLIISG